MTVNKKNKKEVLAAVAARTAKLNTPEPVETGPEREENAATPSVKKPSLVTDTFNPPVSKGDRSYAGPTTRLMNELYDAVNVPAIETFQGWERIALVVSKACERLEKAGWRKGKR